jgi:hypothetical protein
MLMNRSEEMEALYRAGQTLKEIGVVFGVSRERVRQLLAKRGIAKDDGGASVRTAANAKVRQGNVEARRSALDAKWLARDGITKTEFLRVFICRPFDLDSPFRKFWMQRTLAGCRGIEWQLTFPEWWQIWLDSGRYEERGRNDPRAFVMARIGDVGPYSATNVYICTTHENGREWAKNERHPTNRRRACAPEKAVSDLSIST